jgi:membrane fusion protein, multidrug efflux system
MTQVKYIYVLFLTLAIASISCKQKQRDPKEGRNAVPVNTYQVKSEHLQFYDQYPGTVVARNQVELRSEVSGYLTGIFFKDGQIVSKGQKLYEIEQDKYYANLEQAKANVKIAQSNLDRAQQDYDRYNDLSKNDAIAKQQLDHAVTDLQNAKSQVLGAKQQLSIAQTDYKNSVIVAPFQGTIGISQVKLGTLISPGQTLLNVISSDDPMGVDFVIDEKDLGRFTQLEKTAVKANDTTFSILLPDTSVDPDKGRIDFIDRAVDPQTGTIKVRLVVPNKDMSLRPGMSCTVQALNQSSGSQVVIPYKAVSEQMSEYFVFVVDSMKAKQTKIRLGPIVNDKVIVSEGLKPGETIVVDGIQKLHDQTPVQVGTPNKKTSDVAEER